MTHAKRLTADQRLTAAEWAAVLARGIRADVRTGDWHAEIARLAERLLDMADARRGDAAVIRQRELAATARRDAEILEAVAGELELRAITMQCPASAEQEPRIPITERRTTMDREALRVLADLDQTQAEVRTAIQGMGGDELIELFRDCVAGRLDGPNQPLIGKLAAMAICHFCQSRDELDVGPASGPACPQCGEDDIDRLVWIDDDRVRCANCGTVFHPIA